MGALRGIKDKRTELTVKRLWTLLVLSSLVAGCQAPGAEGMGRSTTPSVSGLQDQRSAEELARERRWSDLCVSAGGRTLPDLPAALVTSRLEERAAALDLLGRDLAGPDGPELRDFFAVSLRDLEAEPLGWAELARASARLALYEGEPALVEGLESDSLPRQVAAREALYLLRGVWFQDSVTAEAYRGEGAPPSAALTAALRAQTERLRADATALYQADPARASLALGDPDPSLRGAAVEALLASLSFEEPPVGLDPERVRAALLERLKVEPHPLVLHTLITGFLEQLGPQDACTRDGREFASALHARSASCDAATFASLIYGLTRMPLDSSVPARDEAGVPNACSLSYATTAIVGGPAGERETGLFVEWADGTRRLERDSLASALRSLEVFFERQQDGRGRAELRELLLALIEDSERDSDLRAGAVRVVARAGRAEDLARLGAVLQDAPTSVAYELIATITKLAEGVEASSEAAIAARDALVGMLSRGEASLRRRALAMLATAPLAPLAETTDAGLFLAVLERDLSAEESMTLLELLARRGDPELVPALFEHSAFARLAATDSGVSTVLTETLGRLAAGDGPMTHEVARRLLETKPSTADGELAASEGVQRLRNALALLARLDDGAARSLSSAQHADVVGWAMELREAAGTLAGVTTEAVPTAFLLRLTELHIPVCDPDSEIGYWAYPAALLNADLFAALNLERTDAQWERVSIRTRAHFERAKIYAQSKTGDLVDELEVARDLARFYVLINEVRGALREYRQIVAQESGAGLTADTSVLELSDLRSASAIAATEGEGLAGGGQAQSAFELTLTLVQREFWMSEPAGVRLGDLSALVERGRGSEANVATLRRLFAGLPVPGVDPADAVLPEEALWRGIESDPEGLRELRRLESSLEARSEEQGGDSDEVISPDEPQGSPKDVQGEEAQQGP